MNDTISRAKAIEALKQQAETMSEWSNRYAEQRKGILTAVNIVEDLPPAQPERIRGRWIKISPANIYECSECGKSVMTNDICAYDFCHGCGAEMEVTT